MRFAVHRAVKYAKKVRGLVIPGQAARYMASLPIRRRIEECVKVAGITPMLQIPYIAYLEQLVKYASGNKLAEAIVIYNKWLLRGLDGPTLIALGQCIGISVESAAPPFNCHYLVDGNTIGLWYLDDGAGVIAADETATWPLSLRGVGEPAWNALSKCGDWALLFDGINDYIDHATLIDTVPAAGTLEFWFKPTSTWNSTSGLIRIFSKYGAGGGEIMIMQHWGHSTGQIEFYIEHAGSGHRCLTTKTSWTAGTWYHIACTWGATGMKLYIDGIIDDTDPYVGNWNNGVFSDFTLGLHPISGLLPMDATLDEIRLSNVQRTVFLIY